MKYKKPPTFSIIDIAHGLKYYSAIHTYNIIDIDPDLGNGTSLYSCGVNLDATSNGRLCSRFRLEYSPRDDLTRALKQLLIGTFIGIGDTFTYCRCRGHFCNGRDSQRLKCFSSSSVDEETQSLYSMERLNEEKVFASENLVSCPTGITQCYRYGNINTI